MTPLISDLHDNGTDSVVYDVQLLADDTDSRIHNLSYDAFFKKAPYFSTGMN